MKAIIYIESEQQQGEDLIKLFEKLIDGLKPAKEPIAFIRKTEQPLPAINDPLGTQLPTTVVFEQPLKRRPLIDIEPVLKERLTSVRPLVKNCAQCGKEFKPKTVKSIYCSEQCGKNHWYHTHKVLVGRKPKAVAEPKPKRLAPQKEIINCKQCGTPFMPDNGNQKYCSHECVVNFHHRKIKITRPETRECEVCHQPFKPLAIHSRVCGKKCATKSWKNRRDGLPVDYVRNQYNRKPKAPATDQNATPSKNISQFKTTDTQAEMKRAKAIKASPDLSTKIPVRIDDKTIIYIDKSRDPEEAKANYLLKHKM